MSRKARMSRMSLLVLSSLLVLPAIGCSLSTRRYQSENGVTVSQWTFSPIFSHDLDNDAFTYGLSAEGNLQVNMGHQRDLDQSGQVQAFNRAMQSLDNAVNIAGPIAKAAVGVPTIPSPRTETTETPAVVLPAAPKPKKPVG